MIVEAPMVWLILIVVALLVTAPHRKGDKDDK